MTFRVTSRASVFRSIAYFDGLADRSEISYCFEGLNIRSPGKKECRQNSFQTDFVYHNAGDLFIFFHCKFEVEA